MFLGLLDSDPDPSIISKYSEKNLVSTVFITFLLFYFLSLKNDVEVPSKSNMLEKICLN
jgi:hypothetical protein